MQIFYPSICVPVSNHCLQRNLRIVRPKDFFPPLQSTEVICISLFIFFWVMEIISPWWLRLLPVDISRRQLWIWRNVFIRIHLKHPRYKAGLMSCLCIILDDFIDAFFASWIVRFPCKRNWIHTWHLFQLSVAFSFAGSHGNWSYSRNIKDKTMPGVKNIASKILPGKNEPHCSQFYSGQLR